MALVYKVPVNNSTVQVADKPAGSSNAIPTAPAIGIGEPGTGEPAPGSRYTTKPGTSMATKIVIGIVIIAAAIGIYWFAFKRKKK